MYDLVIKNGRVVNADASFDADVAINGETIAAIGKDLAGSHEIDATGKLVTPGAIDGHVHMQMTLPGGPTSTDTFFTGTRSAAFGGTTTIIDFAECKRREPMADALTRRRAEADPQAVVDYALEQLVRCVGSDARKHFVKGFATDWADNPLTRGAYGAVRPGAWGARAVLAEPLAEKLFFAGEAMGGAISALVNGAFVSGRSAARAMARALA